MSLTLREFQQDEPVTDEDWVVYSQLQKNVEKLIINSLVAQFGASATQSIIQTGAHRSGQSKSSIFSDFDNFVSTIKDVFGEKGHGIILDCLNMEECISEQRSLVHKMGKQTHVNPLSYIKYAQ